MADQINAQEGNNAAGAPAPAAAAPDLRQELIRERFEAVAARSGLDESVVDLVAPAAHGWLEKNGRAGTKQDLADYMAELRVSKPKLFGAATAPAAPTAPPVATAPANTAPVMPNAHAAAPTPGAIENPFSRWRALLAAGRRAEAEAYYRTNRRAIARNS
jgi:hypothetical protein